MGVCLALVTPTEAVVERFEEIERRPLLGGMTFGETGAYELVVGKLHFALDPAAEANVEIIDLDLAPRDAEGRVRWSAAVTLLRPVEPSMSNGTLLLEVPNRGAKSLTYFFHRGAERSNHLRDPEDLGDGLLLQRGFTLAWVGWQQDLPFDPELLGMDRVEIEGDPPLRGLARAEQVLTDPLRSIPLGHRGHRAYPAADPTDPRHVLMIRASADAPRRVIHRDRWNFARLDAEGRVVADPRWITLDQALPAGTVVELVYLAEEPVVVGLALATVRDAASFFKHGRGPVTTAGGAGAASQDDSPVRARRVLGFGLSQGGRFLRHFLYQGFNRDVTGRRVFDGVLIHTAGAGRGSFNHRFAQPSRDGQPFSSIDFPTDLFPFATAPQEDPLTGAEGSLLARAEASGTVPRVMLTSTGYDYWGRGMALTHTQLDGRKDLDPGPAVRLYHFSSSQHFVDNFPPAAVGTRWPGNPVDFRFAARALLLALDAWVSQDVEPPASRYPHLGDRTLVAPAKLAFPKLRGVVPPSHPRRVHRLDCGPRFAEQGILDWQPPIRGEPYPLLVPQVDALGNEKGGLRLPEVEVPVATLTGWNLRAEALGASDEMADFRGAFLPLSRTLADRQRHGDARRSLAELYTDREQYLERYGAVAHRLVEQGYLLEEDLDELLRRAEALWDAVAGGAIRLPMAP